MTDWFEPSKFFEPSSWLLNVFMSVEIIQSHSVRSAGEASLSRHQWSLTGICEMHLFCWGPSPTALGQGHLAGAGGCGSWGGLCLIVSGALDYADLWLCVLACASCCRVAWVEVTAVWLLWCSWFLLTRGPIRLHVSAQRDWAGRDRVVLRDSWGSLRHQLQSWPEPVCAILLQSIPNLTTFIACNVLATLQIKGDNFFELSILVQMIFDFFKNFSTYIWNHCNLFFYPIWFNPKTNSVTNVIEIDEQIVLWNKIVLCNQLIRHGHYDSCFCSNFISHI